MTALVKKISVHSEVKLNANKLFDFYSKLRTYTLLLHRGHCIISFRGNYIVLSY